MNKTINIVIMGTGGQGSLLASTIFGNLFMNKGLDVKNNEVHGMSQRGGSVVTMMRAGEHVHSPILTHGTADILVGLEAIEASRGLPFLKPGGFIAASTQMIIPVSARGRLADREKWMLEKKPGMVIIDALDLARQAGSELSANVAVLGAVSTRMDFSDEEWHVAIRSSVKPELADVNIKAFALGKAAAS